MTDTIDKIKALATLQHNWDSYGGTPPTQLAIEAALAWYNEYGTHHDLPQPGVVPCPNGAVQLEWHKNCTDLEITFPPYGGPVMFCYEAPGHNDYLLRQVMGMPEDAR